MTATIELATATAAPRLGQRVRFTRSDHPDVPPGRGGFIEHIAGDEFFVLTDCGGFFGWTSFASWQPTSDPDVELSDEFKAARAHDPNASAAGFCKEIP